MQLTTVGQEVWRGAKLAQKLGDAGAADPTVQERLRKLKLVQSLRKGKIDWTEIQALVGISRATYHRWKQELERQGLMGLKPQSKRPRRLRRKVLWTPELLSRIEALRKENPAWGRWPIWLSLRKEGHTVSERTVGRMLAYLEDHGRVERVASFLARARRGGSKRRVERSCCPEKTPGVRSEAARRPGAGGYAHGDSGDRSGHQALFNH